VQLIQEFLGLEIRRFNLQRAREVPVGILVVFSLQFEFTDVDQGLNILLIVIQANSVVLDGIRVIVVVTVGRSQIEVTIGGGVQVSGSAVVLDSLLIISLQMISIAQVVEGWVVS
jgi:hypothetical protein